MKIKELNLKNLMCYEDSTVELSDGLTVITGDSDGGKSVVIRGLLQTAKNEPAGANLLRNGVARGVNSEFTMTGVGSDGKPFKIQRIRGRTANEYAVNDTQLKAIGVGSPEEVDRILNLSPNAVQGQFDGSFLLSETDGQVARIVGSAIGLEEIDKMFSYIRGKKNDVDAAVRMAEILVRQESESLAQYEGLDDVGKVVKRVERCQKLLDKTQTSLEHLIHLRSTLAALPEDRIEDIEKLDKKLSGLSGDADKLSCIRRKVEGLGTLLSHLRASAGVCTDTILKRIDKVSTMLSSATEQTDRLRGLDNDLTALSSSIKNVKESSVPDNLEEMINGANKSWKRWTQIYGKMGDKRLEESTIKGFAMDIRDAHESYLKHSSEVVQANAALIKYKRDNPLCPECGAKQKDWGCSDD